MEILGIGPSELVFIVLIAIIILGPKDMQKAGRSVGRWLNQFVRSDSWKALQRASKEIRDLPTTLMREANMEELRSLDKDIRQSIDPRHPTGSTVTTSPTTPINSDVPPSSQTDPSPQPSTDAAETQESESK